MSAKHSAAFKFAEAATTTTGGTQFYSALQQRTQLALGGIYTGTITPIQYPQQGDFLWNFLNPNQVFNNGTYDYISANVSPGSIPGTAQLSPSGGFANAYVQVLQTIAFSLSASDSDLVNKTQLKASTQEQTLIADYQTQYGPITDTDLQAAKKLLGPLTLKDYVISYMMGYVWSGMQAQQKPPLQYTTMANARNLRSLLPYAPPSADQVITDVSTYLSIMEPVNVILSNQQQGAWILKQLINNTQTPTTSNGGMSTVNPINGSLLGPNVGYGLGSASVASIQNDLSNKGRMITMGMTTSSASGNQINVSVQGQAGFTVGSWLQFSTSAGATYDMSQVQGTSTSASVSMTWTGFSVVPISPTAWQQATSVGWYYADPIAIAVQNGNQDITGFRFVQPVPYNLGPLASGGNFGVLSNLLIANYPTVSITYTNANFSEFKQAWSEQASGNLSLFGWINLGSFSQGAYGSSYQAGADNSTFTLTFSASPQVVGLPTLQQQAYVIGGAFNNPGASSPGKSHAVKPAKP